MLQVLAGIADPIEQDHFVNEVASLLATRPGDDSGARATRYATAPANLPRHRASVDVHVDADDVYLLALLMRLRQTPDLATGTEETSNSSSPRVAPCITLWAGRSRPRFNLSHATSIANWSLSSVYQPRSSRRELERTRLPSGNGCSFANRRRSGAGP